MTRQRIYILIIISFYLTYLRGTRGLGERCTSTDYCRGQHEYCSQNSSVCECQEKFTASEGLCEAVLGSSCELTLCHDRYSMCTENYICKCKYGYVQDDGICKAIRGFQCEGTECYDKLMSCDSESGQCDCKEGYLFSGNRCYPALGGNCSDSHTCSSEYSTCLYKDSSYVCECLNGYVEKNGYCQATLGFDCSRTDCFHGNALCKLYKRLYASVCVCPHGVIQAGNYCLPGVGAECRTVGQCADEHAYCDTDSICKCVHGYTESSGICAKDSNTCIPDDCYHSKFRCSNIKCTCDHGYVQDNNTCKAELGQKCGSGICLDKYASCDYTLGTCQCTYSYIYDSKTATCKPDIGTNCSERNCFPHNSFCNSDKICECLHGYTQLGWTQHCEPNIGANCSEWECLSEYSFCNRDKICECIPGYRYEEGSSQCMPGVGKNCSSIGWCSSGTNCISGICQCHEGYGEINGYCYPGLGWGCDSKTCYGAHVSCYNWHTMFHNKYIEEQYNYYYDYYMNLYFYFCVCDDGYRMVGYTCVADIGENCSRVPCASKSMRCSNNSECICKEGFAEIDGTCRAESLISCNSDECMDDSSNCNLESNCSCPSGHKLVDNKCRAELTSTCGENVTVCADKHAHCRGYGLQCECMPGYTDVNGSCIKAYPELGSHCSKDEDCYLLYSDSVQSYSTLAYDRSASCINNICSCKPGYVGMKPGLYIYYRQCLPDIGSNCTSVSSCYNFPSIVCSPSGICECANDPNPSTDLCERGVGDLCGSVTDGDNGTCYDPNASCRKMSYIYNGFAHSNGLIYSITSHANYTSFANICICNDGFKQSGAICKADLGSSCTRAACYDRNAACMNNVCVCKTGYIAINGICRDVEDICAGSGVKCDHICILESNVTRCTCNQGYKLLADNMTCTDINECADDGLLNKCKPTDGCVNNNGSYECRCAIGYKLQNDRRTCLACTGNTYGKNCSEKCPCSTENVHVSSQACHHVNGSCLCKPQWTGSTCREDVNECQNGNMCHNKENSECFNTAGGYTCHCQNGYTEKDGICINGTKPLSDGNQLRFDYQFSLCFLIIYILWF